MAAAVVSASSILTMKNLPAASKKPCCACPDKAQTRMKPENTQRIVLIAATLVTLPTFRPLPLDRRNSSTHDSFARKWLDSKFPHRHSFLAIRHSCVRWYSACASAYWNGAQYQGEPQEYDPYYELHAMHYQLYLPQYPAYTSCCFQGGIVVPGWYGSVAPLRPIIINPRPRRLR